MDSSISSRSPWWQQCQTAADVCIFFLILYGIFLLTVETDPLDYTPAVMSRKERPAPADHG